jgi:hypothetical protein
MNNIKRKTFQLVFKKSFSKVIQKHNLVDDISRNLFLGRTHFNTAKQEIEMVLYLDYINRKNKVNQKEISCNK